MKIHMEKLCIISKNKIKMIRIVFSLLLITNDLTYGGCLCESESEYVGSLANL